MGSWARGNPTKCASSARITDTGMQTLQHAGGKGSLCLTSVKVSLQILMPGTAAPTEVRYSTLSGVSR